MQYLIAHGGLSVYGAAGLVSRWANVESTGGGTAAVNPSSGAFGIAQWLGSRKRGIYPNTNFDAQLAYAIQELNGSEYRAGNVLRKAGDANTAAIGASVYERAEGYNANTGRDNFTARTAAGIPQALAYLGGTQDLALSIQNNTQAGAVAVGLGGAGALLLIGGLVLAYYLLSD